MIVFKAKTRDGYVMKLLAELLRNNFKTASFVIDERGMELSMIEKRRTILVHLFLDANKFNVYKFRSDEKMYIGLNLTHYHKMLKSVKKRDSVQFFIDDRFPTDFCIKVIPKENNRITTSTVQIQDIQNLEIDLPEGYDRPIIVPSGEFQKMIKGMDQISSTITIRAENFHISFESDAGGVMRNKTEFGETEESDDDDDEDEEETEEYCEEFDTEQLSRITKLSGLSPMMQIYPKKDKPLLFYSNVGIVGEIKIFLKSKGQIEAESHAPDSDNDEF